MSDQKPTGSTPHELSQDEAQQVVGDVGTIDKPADQFTPPHPHRRTGSAP